MSDPGRQKPNDGIRARVARLRDAACDDLSGITTAAERVAMVEVLSRRMWEISGRPLPTYARSEMPARVVRKP